MAYVNVAEWKPDQVTEWLKGLDSSISSHLQFFLNHEINGQQLLNIRSEDLSNLGIRRLGHQELILEAVEHLRNFHYELDRENLQLLALRLSCQAHSLHNELLRHTDSQPVSTQTLADVASVVRAVKPLVCWLDRSPFSGQLEYTDRKTDLLKYSLEIATCAQRDRFAERPVEEIRSSCGKLAIIADSIVQDIADPLILQPASLDLATLRKRGGDDLGFFILPSYYGLHQIGEIKFGSPAHQCGKVEEGDEVVQVNYQTVVGWQRKKVMALFEESLTDVFLTLKKRPRHTKVYGQIYMKPYRLPSKKRAPAYTRWHDNLPSPRPELFFPDFEIPAAKVAPKTPPSKHIPLEPVIGTITSTSSESDDIGSGCDETSIDYELEGHASPTSMRLYLPKPRGPVQRRATITGASPTSHLPPVDLEKFWRELKLEKKWKFSGKTPQSHNSNPECRALRNKSPCEHNERPSTCLGFEKSSSKDYIKQVDYVVKSDDIPKGNLNEARLIAKACSGEQSAFTIKTKFGNEKVPTDSNAQKVEKRYITRLELIVDPHDSRIEFTGVTCSGSEVQSPVTGESQVMTPSTPGIVDDPSKSSNKTRKISTKSQVGELPPHRERGRLDKSFSTPAYDLSGLLGLEKKTVLTDENESLKVSTPNELILEPQKIQNTTSPAATTVEKLCTSTEAVFQFPALNSGASCVANSEIHLSNSCDKNSNPIIGRVVETINRHLLSSQCQKEADGGCDVLLGDFRPDNRTNIVMNMVPNLDLMSNISTPILSEAEEDIRNGNQSSLEMCHLNVENLASNVDINLNCSPVQASSGQPVRSSELSYREHESSVFASQKEDPTPRIVFSEVKQNPPIPPSRHVSSGSSNLLCPSSQQPKVPVKISVGPPEPPPRPNPSIKSPSTSSELPKSLLRTKIISKPVTPKAAFGSPKVTRKKTPLLAKRRTVGVKELGAADNQGWLYRRLRLGDSGAQWIKGWFILKGTTFYGFKSKEATKADCFISLPGFTTSPAEEVKSRKFAFKVYHTGTVFYFAAESEEELGAWLDCLSMATFALDVNTLKTSAAEGAVFSETEDEGDDDDEAEIADSCFPSPKMRKIANFLSGHSNHSPNISSSSGSPKPTRSHQNLAAYADSKVYDIQKRFGSLKKLGYRSKYSNQLSSQSSSSSTSLSSSEQSQDVPSAPHSLDRKVLRFLSSSKSQNVPVPTSQFKSYRRVVATEPCPTYSKHHEGTMISRGEEGLFDVAVGPNVGRSTHFPFADSDAGRNNRGFESRGGETTVILTLEQFMLQRQEEERQQNQPTHSNSDRFQERDQERESNTASQREPTEAYSGYTEDPVLLRHKSLEKRRTPPPAPPPLSPLVHGHSNLRPIPAARTILPASGPTAARDTPCEPPAIVPRISKLSSESPESRELSSSTKLSQESFSEGSQRTPKQSCLKNAAMYQPPPVTFSPSPTLGPSFEMHLDHRGASGNTVGESWESSRSKGAGSKICQLLSPKRGQHSTTSPGQLSSPQHTEITMTSPHRSVIGSPHLNLTQRRLNDECRQSAATLSDSKSSPQSSFALSPAVRSVTAFPSSSLDWSSDHAPPLSPKPTMGVAMLGKKPGPTSSPLCNISNLSALSPLLSPPQTPISAPPDYPGLEYPPVFEPGIYSLSDSSTIFSPDSSLNSPSSDNFSPHQSYK